MLQITVPSKEVYNEATNEFINVKGTTLNLEHSLVSVSKWEAKWCKPFLDKNYRKTTEETIDYIRCMTLTQNVDPNIYYALSNDNIEKIREYIEAPMTATTFGETKKSNSREVITSELIYYWMVSLNIPVDICQKWHLNRLLTLIRVCNVKNTPPKKMSQREIMSRNAALNASRRKQLHSKG